ncbi:hypothetical protein DCAR_0832646 [Daucus carota subsp. sativus]|uniref:Uncharacterized protein n=1 Tax=Daucus carota subsp. sativus TaxID=79200 RepID=A0A175YPK4_DAUCS|nr:hypothetical protein DCAR_0832646 [Daucus carota subsp. sativus]
MQLNCLIAALGYLSHCTLLPPKLTQVQENNGQYSLAVDVVLATKGRTEDKFFVK